MGIPVFPSILFIMTLLLVCWAWINFIQHKLNSANAKIARLEKLNTDLRQKYQIIAEGWLEEKLKTCPKCGSIRT